jgi:hypothetical protein
LVDGILFAVNVNYYYTASATGYLHDSIHFGVEHAFFECYIAPSGWVNGPFGVAFGVICEGDAGICDLIAIENGDVLLDTCHCG